ncbi:hypothetical protein LSH36_193g00019 [Paralvinella palmiformis]|uniref:Disease resistance R13L4/SHOC-2-like LRR domain-containing protein n=1 Tax=Paralvinella palmiformis TaxID=53620 RepID=A0AAD9JSC0_9ANNE|nr:hypothetical protein LSH36_193g00019 [Paralvinella palmiformis]
MRAQRKWGKRKRSYMEETRKDGNSLADILNRLTCLLGCCCQNATASSGPRDLELRRRTVVNERRIRFCSEQDSIGFIFHGFVDIPPKQTEMDEPSSHIKALVRDVGALMKCKSWEELIGRGVTHLTLEDENDVLKTIPDNVSRMSSLWSFTLKKGKVKTLPNHLFATEIRQLSLQECPLKSIDGIQTMVDLNSLELIRNCIQKLPNDIGVMTALVQLSVTRNSLKAVPPSIGRLENLRTLNLCANAITELPDAVTELIMLSHLDVSHNQLKSLPAKIGKLENLITMILSHNHLEELPQSAAELGKLRHLMLSNNRLSSVPKVISKMPELLTLNTSANHIAEMPAASVSLMALILDKNSLIEVPHPVFLCQRLEKLSLQNNAITELPPLISYLKNLRVLQLDGNPIERLPNELCDLALLKQLTMRETKLRDLPRYFDSLVRLVNVDMDQTQVPFIYRNALRKDGVSGLFQEIVNQRDILDARRQLAEKRQSRVAGEKLAPKVLPKPKIKAIVDSRNLQEPVALQSDVSRNDLDFVDPSVLPPPEFGQSVGNREESWAYGTG